MTPRQRGLHVYGFVCIATAGYTNNVENNVVCRVWDEEKYRIFTNHTNYDVPELLIYEYALIAII